MRDEPEDARTSLACGCEVRAYRDFLGRVVGEVRAKGASCTREDHRVGSTIVMPGREHARQE
jgi:hypothetical protein